MPCRKPPEWARRLCREWGAADLDRALASAASGGHEWAMRLCHDEWGAADVNQARMAAAVHAYETYDNLEQAAPVDDLVRKPARNTGEKSIRICLEWARPPWTD